jgi:hypothetical protein
MTCVIFGGVNCVFGCAITMRGQCKISKQKKAKKRPIGQGFGGQALSYAEAPLENVF